MIPGPMMIRARAFGLLPAEQETQQTSRLKSSSLSNCFSTRPHTETRSSLILVTRRLHVAVWYIHRPPSDDMVTLLRLILIYHNTTWSLWVSCWGRRSHGTSSRLPKSCVRQARPPAKVDIEEMGSRRHSKRRETQSQRLHVVLWYINGP